MVTINGRHHMTLKEVADQLGLTPERVRQIESNAIAKLQTAHPDLFRSLAIDYGGLHRGEYNPNATLQERRKIIQEYNRLAQAKNPRKRGKKATVSNRQVSDK